jgi:hypothetical protein
MRLLIFTLAFCLFGNSLFAQQTTALQRQPNYPHVNKILQSVNQDLKAPQSSSLLLRLDSTILFSNYIANDSDRIEFAVFTYPFTGATSREVYQVGPNNTTTKTRRNISVRDNLDRSISVKDSSFANGVGSLIYQYNFYWRGNSVQQFDSIILEFQGDKAVLKEFLYNNNGDELGHREYNYNSDGDLLYVYEINNTYGPDGRITLEEAYSGPNFSMVIPVSKAIYTYSGDTTKYASQIYDFDQMTWLTNSEDYLLYWQNNPDLLWKTFSYQMDENTQQNRLVYSALSTYDQDNREISNLVYTRYDPSEPPNSYRWDYTYVQDLDYDIIYLYDIDVQSGAATIRDKYFNRYTEISNTQTPQLLPEAVKLTPNPAQDQLRVDAGESDIMAIQIFDAAGRLLRDQTFGQPVVILNTADLPRSVATLRIVTNKGVIAKVVTFN